MTSADPENKRKLPFLLCAKRISWPTKSLRLQKTLTLLPQAERDHYLRIVPQFHRTEARMATDSMSNLGSTHSNSVGNTDDGKQQKTLAERMSSLLENTPNSKADQLETPRWKRPLTEQCSQCGKMFSRAADLRLHMRTHTGERPYQCEICPKAFAQSSHLTKHRRVHTGERPYKCALCDLSFTQSSNLKKHVHTHFKVAKKKKPLAAVNDVNVGLTMQDNCAPNPRAPSVGNNSLNSSGNNRPFHKCKFCWRQFLSYTALQVHIKKHIRWPYPSLPTPSTLSSLPIPKPQSSIPVVSRESQHDFNQTHVQQHLSNNLTFPSSSLITAPTNVSYSLTTAPTNVSYSLTTAPTNVSYSLTSSTPIVTDIIDVREGGLGSTTQNPNSLSNNPSKFYKCVKCPARYSDLGDFLNHMCYEHGSVFQCRLCPAFFVRSPDLEAHKNLHTLQARRELERDRTLEKPISTGEPSTSKVVIQSFQCNLCKIRFSSSDDFTRHLEAKHSKDKPPSTPNFGRSLTLAKRSLSRALARQPVASISALQQHLPSRPLRRPDSRLFRPHWGSSTLHSKGASRESTLFGSPSLTNFRGSAVRRLVGLRRPHGCIRCGKSFLRPGDLRLHMRTHTGEKPFRCEMCPKAFAQTSHLTKHRRVHTGERPYKCSSCNLGFTQSSNLKKHVRIHFKPVSNNASSKQPSQDAGPSCWNSCSQNEENQGEGMSTKEELYPCPYCQLTFFMQSALNSHVAECTKSKENICAAEAVQTETATVETPNFEQDQLFQTQFDLETVPNLPNQPDILQAQTPAKDNCEIRIEKSEFQNEVSNSEPVSVKQETDISELQDVKPVQIPLPAPQDPQINLDDFPEPIVPKFEVIDLDDSPSPTNSPSSSSFLSRPMPNFSQQEPSFASSTAPSLVSVAPMMESTTSTLTPTSNVSVTTASIFDSGNPRPHRCTVCGKTFVRSADIRLHMRTHTGERPFRCDICPKAFAQTSHLTKHRRVHTGERPYKCAICRLAFTQSSNLKKHVRTHARKFPDLTKPRFGTGAPAILPESLAANLPDPVSSQTEEAPTNPEIPSLLIDNLDDVDPSFVDNLEATIFESDGCVETKTELQPSVNITQTESASVCPGINSTLRQFQVKTEGSEISVTLPLNDQQGNENGYSKDNPDPFFPANFEDETNYTDLSESLVKQELPLSSSSQLYPVEMPMFQKTSEADIPNFNSSASFSKPPADQVEYLSTTSSDGQILTTVVQSITACNPFETVVIDIDDDNDDSSGNENISQEMHTDEKPYK